MATGFSQGYLGQIERAEGGSEGFQVAECSQVAGSLGCGEARKGLLDDRHLLFALLQADPLFHQGADLFFK